MRSWPDNYALKRGLAGEEAGERVAAGELRRDAGRDDAESRAECRWGVGANQYGQQTGGLA